MKMIESGVIERLRRRDRTATAIVYDLYGARVYSLILRIVKNAEIAEDLVQEAFSRVWTRLGSFDAKRGAFGPWLLVIARNLALNYLRASEGRRSNNPPVSTEMHIETRPCLDWRLLRPRPPVRSGVAIDITCACSPSSSWASATIPGTDIEELDPASEVA